MGSSSSRPSDPVQARLEYEAVRAALPRGLEDERAKDLKYELHWCLARNNWYFSIGGLVLGSFLSWQYKLMQPLAAAAIMGPAADWAYGTHKCAPIQEAYNEHKRKIMAEYAQAAQTARQDVRQHFERSYGAPGPGSGPAAGPASGPGASRQA